MLRTGEYCESHEKFWQAVQPNEAHKGIAIRLRQPPLLNGCTTACTRKSEEQCQNHWRSVMDDKEIDVVRFGECFGSELSDEALEALGGNNIMGAYTLAACTGLSACPA